MLSDHEQVAEAMVGERHGLGEEGQQKCTMQLLFFLFIKNVHSSFILNSPKLKPIQKSTNGRIDKQIMV